MYRAKYKYIHFEGSLYILAAFNRSTSRLLEKSADVLSYLSSKQNLIERTKRLLKIAEWQSKTCYKHIHFVPSRIILYQLLMDRPINTSFLTKKGFETLVYISTYLKEVKTYYSAHKTLLTFFLSWAN